MFKPHADLLEKLTAGALLVGMFQENIRAVWVGIVCYLAWWVFHHLAKKKGGLND